MQELDNAKECYEMLSFEHDACDPYTHEFTVSMVTGAVSNQMDF